MAPFMDGVQLPQGYSHFREAVYFLPFISQQLLLLILLTSEVVLNMEPLDWESSALTTRPDSRIFVLFAKQCALEYLTCLCRSLIIVCKGVPLSPPFLSHPLFDTACPGPFFKSLCSLPSVLFHQLLKYFNQSPLPLSPPSWGGNQNLVLPTFKKEGDLNYVNVY